MSTGICRGDGLEFVEITPDLGFKSRLLVQNLGHGSDICAMNLLGKYWQR